MMVRMLPPAIQIRVDPEDSPHTTPPFLQVERHRLVADFPNGTTSEPFSYDLVRRRALDAVIILAHHTHPTGEVHVFLRSSVRPPILFRDDPAPSPVLWELPAGLREPDESPPVAAARELHEELGVEVDPADLHELGPWIYPAPGFIGERQIFFHVEIDPIARQTPLEDGSPLERHATILDIPLREALDLARQGLLPDGKTELALRRLAELVIRP
ncbi:NUDIX hydrolase [Pendulispora rubella]|uniref:GDP-mannose pyrophosphatase n=2 Tax=Pendulispora rubella TaxID=2741070 RepID=A0ABZ2LFJ3_9BACT